MDQFAVALWFLFGIALGGIGGYVQGQMNQSSKSMKAEAERQSWKDSYWD